MNTNMNWNDFNDAEQQTSFELIPKGTLAKIRMTIKPGSHDDVSRGWTDGYATEVSIPARYISLPSSSCSKVSSPRGRCGRTSACILPRATPGPIWGALSFVRLSIPPMDSSLPTNPLTHKTPVAFPASVVLMASSSSCVSMSRRTTKTRTATSSNRRLSRITRITRDSWA